MCSLGLAESLYSKVLKIWLESALKIKYGSGLSCVKVDKADADMIAYYVSVSMNLRELCCLSRNCMTSRN